ncbi:MAG: hypothetical protein CMJ18_25410 [Phycisphaeraceae bacterium]|nr:hypothetical protein [Phycisphaeraceae bacterium]
MQGYPTPRLITFVAAMALVTSSSQAVLLVNLNAADSSAEGPWVSRCLFPRGGYPVPGAYTAYWQPNGPLRSTNGVGNVKFFTTHDAFGGDGFFGADTTPGSLQTPTGNEPQFVLNGPEPGNFFIELRLRRRGSRFGDSEHVFGMKSENQAEQFIVSLSDGDDDQGAIDIHMKDDDGSAVTHLDQVSLPIRDFEHRFDQLAFSWDNAASLMDVYFNGNLFIEDLAFAGVNLDPASVWNETVIFNRAANDATGQSRFNGDFARIRIMDHAPVFITTEEWVRESYRRPPNFRYGVPEPGTLPLATLCALVLLTTRARSTRRSWT